MKSAFFASILACASIGFAHAQLVATPDAAPKISEAPAKKTLGELIKEKEGNVKAPVQGSTASPANNSAPAPAPAPKTKAN